VWSTFYNINIVSPTKESGQVLIKNSHILELLSLP